MWLSKLFRKKVFRSTINGSITIGTSFGKKALFVENVPQSGGEFISMWNKVSRVIYSSGFKPQSLLILGVAGGTALKSFRKYYPDICATGVDIDPVIIEFSQQYFQLGNNLASEIIIADAIQWTRKKSRKKYDLIIVDLYIGLMNPSKAHTINFLKQIKNLLSKKGVALYNCDYQSSNTKRFAKFKKNCEAVFTHVEEIFSYPFNRILLLHLH